MKHLSLIFALLCSIHAGAECKLSAENLVKLEREVLNSQTPSQMAEPLACILRMQQEADGFSRYMASKQDAA